MHIPESYYEYAASFYEEMLNESSSEENFITKGLNFLTSDQRVELKLFLTEALAGGCTISELQRAWIGAGPRFGYRDDDLRGFLDMTSRLIPSGCSDRVS